MGIQGLLRNLHPLLVPPLSHPSYHQAVDNNDRCWNSKYNRSISIRHNIRQFQNKSLAIDASSWLHKAAYTCAERLVESTEKGTRDPIAEKLYTKYIIDRCDELLNRVGVQTIYLVFDGKRVPLKAGTNAEREMKRKANLEEARRLKAAGRYSEASEKYRSCVKGNELMARVVAAEIQKKWGQSQCYTKQANDNVVDLNTNKARVQCVWSPYEADAQLCKLCIDGHAHAVITEDSDVLVYSAVTGKPFPIIYKLDRNDGSCDVVTMDWLLNPQFLVHGKSGSDASRRRIRRRDGKRNDVEYNIYHDKPIDDEQNSNLENNSRVDDGLIGKDEVHCCCVEYDDLGFAPVRRTLPPLTPLAKGESTSHRNGKKSGSAVASGNALLSYLRSFAYKEASNPGAGVRLFVQACVLSGCDYVLNRLTKVGPVTAFKLVKEASHRDASIRFERVLKGLPAGSKLLAESSENGEGKDNNEEEDYEYDDFLSLPDSDQSAKLMYEELLSKSESIFYYHLVRDQTGKVIPLVEHYQSIDVDNNKSDSLDIDQRFRPCITRFENGMAFVGSVSEAMEDRPELLPAITGTTFAHFNNVDSNKTNGGWIPVNRHTDKTGLIQNSVQETANRNRSFTQYPKTHEPLVSNFPKEGQLRRFFKNIAYLESTNSRGLSNNSLSNDVKESDKPKTAHDDWDDDNVGNSSEKENCDHNTVPLVSSTCDIEIKLAKVYKSMSSSPFFSQTKFDYGVHTPEHAKGDVKSKDLDHHNVQLGDCDGKKKEKLPEKLSENPNASLDFGVLMSEPTQMNDFYFYSPPYLPGPRRVSSSPPETMKHEPFSRENVIEIFDDEDDQSISSTFVPNRNNQSAKSVHDVLCCKTSCLRSTKSEKRKTAFSNSHTGKKKKPSSSAVLAGFTRNKTTNILQQQSRFYPIMAKGSNKLVQTTVTSYFISDKVNHGKQTYGTNR